MYPIVTVPDEAPDVFEQLGTKPKFWYGPSESERYLFKFVERESNRATGEDWSEKVSSELCDLLALPHARYDFAIWRDKIGVISPRFVPVGGRLVAGNELLSSAFKRYPKQQFYHVREHLLRRVLAIIKINRIQPPIDWNPCDGVTTALDVFIGYLMLDAWIGNQDRHHENWGMIVSPQRTIHLAPTFDHASSLGWNETDEVRRERLHTRDNRRGMEAYVERALSAFFASSADTRAMPTLDAFVEAAKLRPKAAQVWLARLAQIGDSSVNQIFSWVPPERITRDGIIFAQRMLELNRKRLLALEVA